MEGMCGCGGETEGEYKQRYKSGTRDGEVETYVEWKCMNCGRIY